MRAISGNPFFDYLIDHVASNGDIDPDLDPETAAVRIQLAIEMAALVELSRIGHDLNWLEDIAESLRWLSQASRERFE